jgi:hypothetical protein
MNWNYLTYSLPDIALIIANGVMIYVSYRIGVRRGRKEVINALGVPDGYTISAVHFEKKRAK